VHHLQKTIEFASDIGARAVVVHAGYVDMSHRTPDLIQLHEAGRHNTDRYEKDKMKLVLQRHSKARQHMDFLMAGLDALLPALQKAGITLALENLPSWEALPSEAEMEEIARHCDSPCIRYWHDFGHGYIRDALGLCSHRRWFEKLAPFAAGMHIHDAVSPSRDHLMPPLGKINFAAFKPLIRSDMIAVLEPAPGTPTAAVQEGANVIRQLWDLKE
jgi:sugar phosphate isomerase/epimerase